MNELYQKIEELGSIACAELRRLVEDGLYNLSRKAQVLYGMTHCT